LAESSLVPDPGSDMARRCSPISSQSGLLTSD
jgi:hypothetical protein